MQHSEGDSGFGLSVSLKVSAVQTVFMSNGLFCCFHRVWRSCGPDVCTDVCGLATVAVEFFCTTAALSADVLSGLFSAD